MLLCGLIYWQIDSKSSEYNLIEAFQSSFSWRQFPFLLAAILLMPVNIFLESTKWKMFVNQFQEDFDIVDALKVCFVVAFLDLFPRAELVNV